jgi:hypothetical protein
VCSDLHNVALLSELFFYDGRNANDFFIEILNHGCFSDFIHALVVLNIAHERRLLSIPLLVLRIWNDCISDPADFCSVSWEVFFSKLNSIAI